MPLTFGLQMWPIGRADRIDSIRTTTSSCKMVLTRSDMAKVQVLRKWLRSKLSASEIGGGATLGPCGAH